MKKFLLIVVCCLCLCGCDDKNFQASNFKWKQIRSYYAEGSIKNNSSKECQKIHIDLIYKNGNLEESDFCISYEQLKPGEITNVSCMYTGDIENIYDYKIKIKNIECY